MRQPRGIRNNNPLNIRIGNNWLGECAVKCDPAFEEFTQMRYGIRAAAIILRRYILKYHRTTIREIISSWAPESDSNNTVAYVRTVSHRMQYPDNGHIDADNEKQMCNLIEAMAFVECGGSYVSMTDIQDGFRLALSRN